MEPILRAKVIFFQKGKLSTVYVVKTLVLGLQQTPENSELAPSVLVLSDLSLKTVSY